MREFKINLRLKKFHKHSLRPFMPHVVDTGAAVRQSGSGWEKTDALTLPRDIQADLDP